MTQAPHITEATHHLASGQHTAVNDAGSTHDTGTKGSRRACLFVRFDFSLASRFLGDVNSIESPSMCQVVWSANFCQLSSLKKRQR